jgi:hypothetical protein
MGILPFRKRRTKNDHVEYQGLINEDNILHNLELEDSKKKKKKVRKIQYIKTIFRIK